MISITRMNGDSFILNADLIETVEARPDTLITLTTGNRIMVKETVAQVIEKFKEYKKDINIRCQAKLEAMPSDEQE